MAAEGRDPTIGVSPADDLRGRHAIVIGGSRGVGAATARILGTKGCSIVVTYRTHRQRAEVVARDVASPGEATAAVAQLDISEQADCRRFADALPITAPADFVIICASGGLEIGAGDDYAAKVNSDGPAALVLSLLDKLAEDSAIIYVTSHEAHSYDGTSAYTPYARIARTKRAGEDALLSMRSELEKARSTLKIVSADLIADSYTAKILERMDPGMIERRRSTIGVLPNSHDVGSEIVRRCLDASSFGGVSFVW